MPTNYQDIYIKPFDELTEDNMNDRREWDRENDAHHAVYIRNYDNDNYENQYIRRYEEEAGRHLRGWEWQASSIADKYIKIFCDGEWIVGENEQPDIKEEQGGALDEFLDEFKPQTTTERSDEQK